MTVRGVSGANLIPVCPWCKAETWKMKRQFTWTAFFVMAVLAWRVKNVGTKLREKRIYNKRGYYVLQSGGECHSKEEVC